MAAECSSARCTRRTNNQSGLCWQHEGAAIKGPQSSRTPLPTPPPAMSNPGSVESAVTALVEAGWARDPRLTDPERGPSIIAQFAARYDLDPNAVSAAASRLELEEEGRLAQDLVTHVERIAEVVAATPERPRRGDLIVVRDQEHEEYSRIVRVESALEGRYSGNTVDGGEWEPLYCEGITSDEILRETSDPQVEAGGFGTIARSHALQQLVLSARAAVMTGDSSGIEEVITLKRALGMTE